MQGGGDSGGLFAALFSGLNCVCGTAFYILVVIGLWKTFVKAGQPGWAAIIPIYNIYIMLKIIGRPGWWLILFFIPFVNMAIALIVSIDLAKSFGKTAVWGIILLFFFNAIGYLLLGFGDATYQG